VLVEEVDSTGRRRNLRPLKIIAGIVVSFSLFTLVGSVILSALGLPDALLRWVSRSARCTCRAPDRVLAAISVAGATGQIGWRTVVLTVSFAIGAALPLLIFASVGSRISQRVKAFRDRARGFRIAGGIVMLVLAVALAFNATDVIQRALPSYISGIEQKVAENNPVQGALAPAIGNASIELARCTPGAAELADCGPAPAIAGTQKWFNTPGGKAVSLAELKSKVVLIDFWAYSCRGREVWPDRVRASSSS
jgi:hypothetical protein